MNLVAASGLRENESSTVDLLLRRHGDYIDALRCDLTLPNAW